MAIGVILNLIISTNTFLAIILLQAIAFSRSSYLAGVNIAVAYRMVISLLPLGEGWDGATFVSCLRLHLIIYIGHTAPKEETQKALASSEGYAFVAITQLAAGKHVFLRATSAITTVMLSMTSEDAKEQKAAYGRKKSPAYAGKKTTTMERPFSGSPQGESELRHNGFGHWDYTPLPWEKWEWGLCLRWP